MTIASEITRLQNDKSAMCTAIENKGVTVGNVTLDDYAACIDAIQQGCGDGCKVEYTVVGGGGGGGFGNGGGGGAVCVGLGNIDSNIITVTVGTGGCGYNRGTTYNGGDSCISGGTLSVIANGGKISYPYNCTQYSTGGVSGSGYSGGVSCFSSGLCFGGGGGGAGGYGCPGCCKSSSCKIGGNGGVGIRGMGGGGGGYGGDQLGCGVDGGGVGGGTTNNATTYGGGGGASSDSSSSCGGNGYKGVVILCYPTDGSYGYTNATGGTITTCGGYNVHTFTSDGTFTIPNKITTKGIYYNQEKCLISLSGNGSQWITLQDRNVGAYSNDISSPYSHGAMFQRGNNYGFSDGCVSNTINLKCNQIDAGSCGPSLYYCNEFIYDNTGCNRDWSSSQNDNLRGNTTNTCEARRGPSPIGFHVPTRTEISNLISAFCSIKGSDITSSDAQTYLCIPFTGYRSYNNGTRYCGRSCFSLWTSSPVSGSYLGGNLWGSTNITSSTYYNRRGTGYAVRAFANTPVQPDETWCKWL